MKKINFIEIFKKDNLNDLIININNLNFDLEFCPICFCSKFGSINCLKELLLNGYLCKNFTCNLIENIIEGGNIEILEFFTNYSINFKGSWKKALKKGNIQIINYLYTVIYPQIELEIKDETTIFDSILSGNFEIVKLIYEIHPNCINIKNENDEYPNIFSLKCGYINIF